MPSASVLIAWSRRPRSELCKQEEGFDTPVVRLSVSLLGLSHSPPLALKRVIAVSSPCASCCAVRAWTSATYRGVGARHADRRVGALRCGGVASKVAQSSAGPARGRCHAEQRISGDREGAREIAEHGPGGCASSAS